MEPLYAGRAIIEDSFDQTTITIPSKKNWFALIFLGAWLCGWFCGEVAAIGAVTGIFGKNSAGFFLLFWLAGWTVGGVFAFRFFYWMAAGKEVITVGNGTLCIDKKGSLFSKPKTYDLNNVKNMRVQDTGNFNNDFGFGTRNTFSQLNGGVIRFSYGFQTVKFAIGIDDTEANYILDTLKEKKKLQPENFDQ